MLLLSWAGETTLAVGLIFPLFICVRVWSRSEIPHTGRLMIPHQRLPLLLVLSSLPSLTSLLIPGDAFFPPVLLRGGRLRSIISSCYRCALPSIKLSSLLRPFCTSSTISRYSILTSHSLICPLYLLCKYALFALFSGFGLDSFFHRLHWLRRYCRPEPPRCCSRSRQTASLCWRYHQRSFQERWHGKCK
jgi:hypothetical protein